MSGSTICSGMNCSPASRRACRPSLATSPRSPASRSRTAASVSGSPGGTRTAAPSSAAALRRGVRGHDRAARGGPLEHLVRHHAAAPCRRCRRCPGRRRGWRPGRAGQRRAPSPASGPRRWPSAAAIVAALSSPSPLVVDLGGRPGGSAPESAPVAQGRPVRVQTVDTARSGPPSRPTRQPVHQVTSQRRADRYDHRQGPVRTSRGATCSVSTTTELRHHQGSSVDSSSGEPGTQSPPSRPGSRMHWPHRACSSRLLSASRR